MQLLDLILEVPLVYIMTALVLGLMVGSFLNVVIYRLPLMMKREWRLQCCEYLELDEKKYRKNDATAKFKTFNLVKPDSHCPQCKAPVRAWQNIPLVSYAFLGGKCGKCKAKISPRYPIIELVTGVLTAVVAWHIEASWFSVAAMILTWCLVALTMIDFDHQLLPDSITLPLLWLGLVLAALGLIPNVSTADSIIGAAAGYLSLWSIYWVFKLLTGKEGMGYGDFKLLAVFGAWMGWQSLLLVVILSSLVGAVVGIGLIVLRGRDRNIPIPFGPYLAGAGYIALIWGEPLTQSYLQLLS
ncbi:MAG: A24 family peptidase [Pseudohongiellaceae bacterium]|nr:A24 family peptidase [Pseudohongiellaceae bacterium]